MSEFIVSLAAWFSAMCFAALWGAHVFDTSVLVRTWTAEPPKTMLEFIATPYGTRVGRYFRILVPSLGLVTLIAAIVAIAADPRTHLALAIVGACGLIHLALIFLFFIPTNVKLGLIPGGAGAASLDPQVVKTLVRRWVGWNYARLGVDTVGLVAALFAFRGS